ncbi:MAG: alpha/beta fold hydrolase [Saprospiraceae bacterium]
MPNTQQTTILLQDNSTLGITIFPTGKKHAPTLLIYPAFGVKATYYTKFSEQLTQKSIRVVTADLRGHGLSSVRPDTKNNYGFLAMINDLKAVSDYLLKENPTSKIYILGHSLGGQAASLAAAKYQGNFAGLATIGSPNVHYKGWSGFHYYRRKIGLKILPMIGKVVAILPPFKIGGYYTTPRQMQEWGYTGQTGNYQVEGDDFDYEKAMAMAAIPVLAIDIEGDLMAPKAAIANLYQKFKNTTALTTSTLTKAATNPKLSHINWPRTATEVMVQVVEDWLRQSGENN